MSNLRDERIGKLLDAAKNNPTSEKITSELTELIYEKVASIIIEVCENVFKGKKEACLDFIEWCLDHKDEVEQNSIFK